jgi:hypothetical protein
MTYRLSPSQPRRPGRATPRTRRPLTMLGGLAVFLTAAIGLAPGVSATLPPPEPSAAPVPPPPPPTTATAHFPMWAVVAIVAATVVLSVATTLITLSLAHMRRARHTPAAGSGPEPGAPSLSTALEEAGQGEILGSQHHSAGHDVYRVGSD